MPKNSLASIVYTQSFPRDGILIKDFLIIILGDFIRPMLPMDYSVALRRNFADSLTLSFIQVDKDLRYECYEYLNVDKSRTLNDTLRLNCDSSNTNNKTISGITLKKGFNGLLAVGLQERRLSAHHKRFIDYQDRKFNKLFKRKFHFF